MSPGTMLRASIWLQAPSLRTKAWGDWSSLSAEIAFSASRSFKIPTTPLQIKIVKITAGSTQAGTECSSCSSLRRKKKKDEKNVRKFSGRISLTELRNDEGNQGSQNENTHKHVFELLFNFLPNGLTFFFSQLVVSVLVEKSLSLHGGQTGMGVGF